MRLPKEFISGFILLLTVVACQDEVNRTFSTIEVTINDTNRFAILDSIFFVTADTLANKLTVITEVSDVILSYSMNNKGFVESSMESITIQKEDSIFQFYLTKPGFDDSEIKTISFQSHTGRFLDKADYSSIISDSDFYIELNDKSRGMLKVEIWNMSGIKMLQRDHFKGADNLKVKYGLEEYPVGLYIVNITYGTDKKPFRLIKQK